MAGYEVFSHWKGTGGLAAKGIGHWGAGEKCVQGAKVIRYREGVVALQGAGRHSVALLGIWAVGRQDDREEKLNPPGPEGLHPLLPLDGKCNQYTTSRNLSRTRQGPTQGLSSSSF